MLQALRSKGLASVVYGVLIVGMALVFILGFNPSAGKQKASLGEACAARVKGHCITPKDHMSAYRLLIPRGEQNEPQMARAKQMGILRVSLDGLVERELLVNDAERLGITVTEDEVTDAIYDGFIHVSLPSDKVSIASAVRVFDGKMRVNFKDSKSKKFDLKVYERSIKAATGRSPTEFREEQAREILAAKVRDLVRTPVRVSESEALAGYIEERSTATLNTITVRSAYLAKYLPPPLPKDVDAWANDPGNKKALDDGVEERKTPHLRHILIKTEAGATPAAKDAAKARLLAALERVKKGESFAAVAKDVSEDPGSAPAGGDVGDRTDGFVAPFKEAADKLKPGEMTDAPVETVFGYHAILRDAPMSDVALRQLVAGELFVKARAQRAAKEMADKIQADLMAGRDAQKVLDEQIATLAPATPAPAKPPGAPPPAADGKGAPAPKPAADTPDTDSMRPMIIATAPFNKGGEPIPSLSAADNTKVIAFAFSAKDKDGLDHVLQADHDYVLVSLKEHKTATKDEFAKDKEIYLQTLVKQKEDEAFSLYMKRLKDGASSEIKIDEKYLEAKLGTSKKTTDGGAPAPSQEEEEEEGP
jgi:peptidyl-prolyl cis-trans isomerase D